MLITQYFHFEMYYGNILKSLLRIKWRKIENNSRILHGGFFVALRMCFEYEKIGIWRLTEIISSLLLFLKKYFPISKYSIFNRLCNQANCTRSLIVTHQSIYCYILVIPEKQKKKTWIRSIKIFYGKQNKVNYFLHGSIWLLLSKRKHSYSAYIFRY